MALVVGAVRAPDRAASVAQIDLAAIGYAAGEAVALGCIDAPDRDAVIQFVGALLSVARDVFAGLGHEIAFHCGSGGFVVVRHG